jgi:hypothetical protein
MRFVITTHWKADGEVHRNPTVVECDDRQDAFRIAQMISIRIAQMISMSRGFHYLEIRDKDASLD